MRTIILEKINEILEESGSSKKINEIHDTAKVFDFGLDSLGFAILVARLEEELNYDPFQLMENAVYPQTFGEFVEIYEKFRK